MGRSWYVPMPASFMARKKGPFETPFVAQGKQGKPFAAQGKQAPPLQSWREYSARGFS